MSEDTQPQSAIIRDTKGVVPAPGIHFIDVSTGQKMCLYLDPSSGWDLWLLRYTPDGEWVSVRKATEQDKDSILRAYHRQLAFTLSIRL